MVRDLQRQARRDALYGTPLSHYQDKTNENKFSAYFGIPGGVLIIFFLTPIFYPSFSFFFNFSGCNNNFKFSLGLLF